MKHRLVMKLLFNTLRKKDRMKQTSNKERKEDVVRGRSTEEGEGTRKKIR
jgi:hypothetical protein